MHPKVKARYEAEAPELLEDYLRKEPANDVNLKRFWELANDSKKEVVKEIYKIVRLKYKGAEYFYYHIKYTSKDVYGNKIQALEYDKGYYEDPEFRSSYDPQTRKKGVTEVEGTQRVYELKWPIDFTQELKDIVSDTVDLLVISTGRKYGGFSFDDFLDRSLEDLITFGRFGTFNVAIQQEIKRRANKT